MARPVVTGTRLKRRVDGEYRILNYHRTVSPAPLPRDLAIAVVPTLLPNSARASWWPRHSLLVEHTTGFRPRWTRNVAFLGLVPSATLGYTPTRWLVMMLPGCGHFFYVEGNQPWRPWPAQAICEKGLGKSNHKGSKMRATDNQSPSFLAVRLIAMASILSELVNKGTCARAILFCLQDKG